MCGNFLLSPPIGKNKRTKLSKSRYFNYFLQTILLYIYEPKKVVSATLQIFLAWFSGEITPSKGSLGGLGVRIFLAKPPFGRNRRKSCRNLNFWLIFQTSYYTFMTQKMMTCHLLQHLLPWFSGEKTPSKGSVGGLDVRIFLAKPPIWQK